MATEHLRNTNIQLQERNMFLSALQKVCGNRFHSVIATEQLMAKILTPFSVWEPKERLRLSTACRKFRSARLFSGKAVW